jgi:hypothetical protein
MIKETASLGPKAGDKIMPIGSKRYYYITRIFHNRAFYNWEPEGVEEHVFNRKEERSIPLNLLVKALDTWLQKSEPNFEPEQKRPKKRYKAVLNWYGGLLEAETQAVSELQAKNYLVHKFAQKINKAAGAVWALLREKPDSMIVKEV